MPITVTDPDGKIHTFADGTSESAINAEMERRWASRGDPPPASPMPPATVPGGMNAQPGIVSSMVPLSDDAMRAQRLLMMKTIQGDRSGVAGAQALLNADPTYEARKKQAEDMGRDAAARSAARRAGINVLRSYAHLRHAFDATPDDILMGAIGPYNIKPYSDYIPGVGGMTVPEANAAYPLTFGLFSDKRPWDTQNRFNHLVHGLTNAFMTSAGKGLTMSDERQKAFESTMRDFMRSSSRGGAEEVLRDAKAVIMNDFGLSPEEADAVVDAEVMRIKAETAHRMITPERKSDARPTQQPDAAAPRKAPDGNYYIPDPNRPGKYLKVVP